MNRLTTKIIFAWDGDVIFSESQKTKPYFTFSSRNSKFIKAMALYLRRNIFRLLPYVFLYITVYAIF